MISWTCLVFASLAATSQAFFFGGGGACGCSAPPACPPPAPPAPCGGGGGYARAYSAPTFAAQSVYQQPPQQLYHPPQPAYMPVAAPASYGSSYAAPQPIVMPPPAYAAPHKRHVKDDMDDTGVDQMEGYVRVKRDDETVFDPKCNSEDLKAIIIANINESTAVAKRQIQTAAADAIGGRVDVICSKGTFSYIVNTELYCETEKDGTTCFAFKQSS